MIDKSSFTGNDSLVEAAASLITPLVREIYAVLVSAGVLHVEN